MATGKASGNTVVTAAATKPSYDQNKAAHWHKPVGGFIFCFGLPQLTFQPSEARRKLDTHAHQTPESFTMKTLLGFTLAVLLLSFVHHGQSQELNQTDLRAANDAWHDGRYADALRGYQRLLNSAAGEQFLEAEIVADRGERRRVGGERESRDRGSVLLVPHDELGCDVLRVGRAAAIAEEQQLPARTQ